MMAFTTVAIAVIFMCAFSKIAFASGIDIDGETVQSILEDMEARILEKVRTQCSLDTTRQVMKLNEKIEIQAKRIQDFEENERKQNTVLEAMKEEMFILKNDQYDEATKPAMTDDEDIAVKKSKHNISESKIASAKKLQRPTKISQRNADNKKLDKRQVENVSFSAYLSHTIAHLAPGHTVIFDKALHNDGDAYNTHTGIFTVPVAGVYFFTFTINAFNRKTDVHLLVDDVSKASTVSIPYSADEMASNSVVIRVNAGQSVWLSAHYDQDGEIVSYPDIHLTSFSGFLLHE